MALTASDASVLMLKHSHGTYVAIKQARHGYQMTGDESCPPIGRIWLILAANTHPMRVSLRTESHTSSPHNSHSSLHGPGQKGKNRSQT